MPRATVATELHHRNLKTLEGGWVKLRQLSFDQMLERRDNALRMSMETSSGRRNNRNANQKVLLDSAMQWTRQFEFSHCIVEHNLEDDNGQPLNFSNPMTLKVLDPKVGQEIERYIEELNQEDEESLEDFTKQLSSSSNDSTTEQSESTEES